MTAETSNARGEWVLVPREPSAGMLDSAENAMIESEWAYNAGEPDARSDAHGFPTMRIWQAVVAYRAMLAAAPQPPSAPAGVDAAKHWHDLYRKECQLRQDDAARYGQQIADLEALAQQPVAVDEAMVDRACDAYVQIADDCMGLVRRKAMRAALTAALATQHQEPTT
jgi:hypothetical protein